MSNTQTLFAETTAQNIPAPAEETSLLGFIAKLPETLRKNVIEPQKTGKNDTLPNDKKKVSYRDIGPARGDGQTDYAKPIWRR